jgi:hypothetical protein
VTYFRRLFKALDILANVMAGGLLETISSRCGKQIVDGDPCKACCLICRLLDLRWKDHCKHNIMNPAE